MEPPPFRQTGIKLAEPGIKAPPLVLSLIVLNTNTTILMGMFYDGKVETMMPKLHSKNFEGMELIRPIYLIREEDIITWRDYNRLCFIRCACRFTENCISCSGTQGSKRNEMKELIAQLREKSGFIEMNIFRSVHNVNLKTIIGYNIDGKKYSFLDDYDEQTC